MAAGYFIRFAIYTLVGILLFQISKREIIAEIGGNVPYKIKINICIRHLTIILPNRPDTCIMLY